MKREDMYGAILEYGATDWQIFQQVDAGVAAIPLAGRYVLNKDQNPGRVTVQVRLVRDA